MMSRMAETPSNPRRGRGGVKALTVLASILGFLAVFSVWAERQLLETDTWTETSTEMLEDEAIKVSVADYLVDQLYANVDVQAELEQRLPPDADGLAGPAAGGLRELTTRAAEEALGRPRVQELWEDANRRAHGQLLAIVEGESEAVRLQGDRVVLDLGGPLTEVSERAGVSGDLVEKIPDDAGELTILRSDQIGTAQDIVSALKGLAVLLTALALGLFGLAVYLARGWRPEALRTAGVAFVLIGLAVLAARALAGTYVVDELATTASVEPAAESVWEIGTSLLRASAVAMIGYGVVIIFGAWLAGHSRVATELRRAVAPYLRERWTAYLGASMIILLILWWNPTPGTSRLVPTLILAALIVAGFEALRAVALRDFPDAQRGDSWAAIREFASLRRPPEHKPPAPHMPGHHEPEDRRLADLERLAELHRAGVLDDEELAREKKRILAPH
jgi:hypothetical protein